MSSLMLEKAIVAKLTQMPRLGSKKTVIRKKVRRKPAVMELGAHLVVIVVILIRGLYKDSDGLGISYPRPLNMRSN